MYKKEAIQIENVQRRATKLVKNIQHLSYSDRSRYLGLPSLQYRRLRGQTIPSVYYSLRETVFSNISSTLLLVDSMLVASGGVLIFRKDFIAIYLIYIVNNSVYHTL
jgi:hypothetical protein